jgi:glycosyltransferase involved in cell wall biosynthesis
VCIYTAQNIFKRYPPPFRQLERRALRGAAAAYPCSTEAGEVLRRKGFAGSLHVLPLGVTAGEPRPRGDGPVRVGFVGRLEPYKGGDVAIRAFVRAGEGMDARLELLGSGSAEGDLRRLVASLGAGDRVSLPGAVPQDEALVRIGGYDALLVPSLTTPSWKEQFGRVAAQAMALGTPVIASDSGALAEVVGGAGLLAREGDVADFAEKLGAVLRDPELAARLVAEGRRRVLERFTWERVADATDRMYREVVATGSGQAGAGQAVG